MDKKEFGQYIEKLRTRKGLSQAELARQAGLANSTIARLEAGGINNPSPKTFIKIAPLLGVDKEHLMRSFGYLTDENTFGEPGNELKTKEKIFAALADDDELIDIFNTLVDRNDLQVFLRQARNLEPSTIKQIMNLIKGFETEDK